MSNTEQDSIDYDLIKETAITTYRCPRGCTLGHVSRVKGYGTVFTSRLEGEWSATQIPWEEPLYVQCYHLIGRLPISDIPQGKVILTQEDVRSTEPKS